MLNTKYLTRFCHIFMNEQYQALGSNDIKKMPFKARHDFLNCVKNVYYHQNRPKDVKENVKEYLLPPKQT